MVNENFEDSLKKSDKNPAPREAVRLPRLYLLATASLCAGRDLLTVVKAAIEGGVDGIQLREKDQPGELIARSASPLRELCRQVGIPFIVNDSLHLAQELAADGLHLGQDDLAAEVARAHLGPKVLIGLSTHNEAQILKARKLWEKGIINYVGLGPIFATSTKDAGRPLGPEVLRTWAAALDDLPCFPIGGIGAGNIAELKAAGAERVAISSAILGAADPAAMASDLKSALLPPSRDVD